MILNRLRLPLIFLNFTLILSTELLCQETGSNDSYYYWYDQMTENSNVGVFSGDEYVENYRVLNDRHKFFDSPNFNVGSIVYEGQPYFNLQLKYDLFEDQLLLKHQTPSISPTLIVDSYKVSSFEINGHQFKNIQQLINGSSKPLGFLEIILTNDSLVLYKKLKKRIRTKTNDKTRYYEFKEDNAYYIFYNDSFFRLKNSANISTIFPNYISQLKTIESQYRSIKKDDPETYLVSVLRDLFINMAINPIEQ
jgi:hypothetical protein